MDSTTTNIGIEPGNGLDEKQSDAPAQVDVQTILSHYSAQVRLARATELAHSGKTQEAEAILVQNGEFLPTARELDLLARIAARQGLFDEARRRWNAALELEPDNEIFRQCLRNLTPARRFASLIANSQDTMVNVLALTMIALAVVAVIYALQR